MRVLVTGGAGFIGSNFVHFLLERTDDEVVTLDAPAIRKRASEAAERF